MSKLKVFYLVIMSFTKLKVLYLVIMFFTVKLRLVQQRLYKKKKDSEILRVNNQIILFCFFPLSSRDIFSWNVNIYKSFSRKLQLSDSQTAASTKKISMNQAKNKTYQQTHGLQIFQ